MLVKVPTSSVSKLKLMLVMSSRLKASAETTVAKVNAHKPPTKVAASVVARSTLPKTSQLSEP